MAALLYALRLEAFLATLIPLLSTVVALTTDLGVESGLADFEVIDLFSYHWQHMSIRNKLFIYFAITNFLCDYWIAVEVNWDINRLFKPCTLYIQWASPSLHEAHPKPIEHSCTQAIPSSILSNLQYLNWLRYKQG